MGFDPKRAEAEISLGRIPPERLPALAQDALEAGYDGSGILQMAILESPSGWQVDQYLPAFLNDLGLHRLPKSDASIVLASYFARDILITEADPFAWADTFYRLYIEADYPPALGVLGQLPDHIYLSLEYGGKNEMQVRDEIRNILAEFVLQH